MNASILARPVLVGAVFSGLLLGTATAATPNAPAVGERVTEGNSCGGKGGCGSSGTSTASTATAEKHSCKGLNTCKGTGGCKTGDNGCAGKNSCKGKGGCAVPVVHK